tara:strand:+ start:794 stop:1513 length:720 start_codon:yes stop_codon:yes gene_type:complete
MQELHWLNIRDLDFPDPERALTVPNGLLAAGGDLNPERLLRAYKHGIFPWYEAGQPILWWSPDPRMVLYPDELHISKSLQKTLNKAYFSITWNHDFRAVINSCAGIGIKNREDTWISSAMKQAYTELHEQGWAHSLEVWQDEKLVGGLYGIAMGRVFFGESMFSKQNDASKLAFVHLVKTVQGLGFSLIDCQVANPHLASLGAREIRRSEFIKHLATAIDSDHLQTACWPEIGKQLDKR